VKVAVVYNRESKKVVNLFGMPNKEKIGMKTIERLCNALKKGGHQVVAIEGDKDLVDSLEEFMPRVVSGERPGMVFNVSYGIQGQARYTHVPSILEMVGIPYVASGPLAHSLSLDKVVTKMILRQHGLPTPDFAVMDSPDASLPELTYPMIVKPKNEAVSFGLKVVHDETELRDAARVIFDEYRQPVLVEQYIEGREVNVGLLGNNPPEALPPVELLFGEGGPQIYTYEDKTGRSGRTVSHACPAPIGEELLAKAEELAVKAFQALGCADCARVDMRMDGDGRLYILEINSLPSLGEHGSYLIGAAHVGLDFADVINRLVEEASARYFGTPKPPTIETDGADAGTQIFSFITQRRDRMERRLREWTNLPSHTIDPVDVMEAVKRAKRLFEDLKMPLNERLTDERAVWLWETRRGFEGGTLLVAHLDVPVSEQVPAQRYRKEPEWLFGDGVGSSRGPIVMVEYALRAIRSLRKLRGIPLGVLLYTDEGRDARYSADRIRDIASRAGQVLVLRPGNVGHLVISRRRGQRTYRFRTEGKPARPGKSGKKNDVLRWTMTTLEAFAALTRHQQRVSISTLNLHTERLPMLLPHRVTASVLVTYPDSKIIETVEKKMREIPGRGGPRWELERVADRPPMIGRETGIELFETLEQIASQWEIPLRHESSVWPSVAGLVPVEIPCLCGLGPEAKDLGTPQEAVYRISLVERTLLLAQYLARELGD
jgi:D-alanine-D-alanine ligase